jgi:hypothetical protein
MQMAAGSSPLISTGAVKAADAVVCRISPRSPKSAKSSVNESGIVISVTAPAEEVSYPNALHIPGEIKSHQTQTDSYLSDMSCRSLTTNLTGSSDDRQ